MEEKNKNSINIQKRKNRHLILYSMVGLLFVIGIIFTILQFRFINQTINNHGSITYYDNTGTKMLTIKKKPISINEIPKRELALLNTTGESYLRSYIIEQIFNGNQKGILTNLKKETAKLYFTVFVDEKELVNYYLNELDFKTGIIGMGTAAEYFFRKQVNELDSLEWSYLLALEKISHNQIIDENNEQVRDYMKEVLEEYYKTGVLSKDEFNNDKKDFPHFLETMLTHKYAYCYSYLQYAYSELIESNNTPIHSNLAIYLNIDQKVQKELFNQYIKKDNFPKSQNQDNGIESSMVIVNHKNGELVAMMGSRNPFAKVLNRVDHPRQPASTMKPLVVYGPAMELGWKRDDRLKDVPFRIGTFQPLNYDYIYRKEVSLEEGLVMSYNVPTVWLLQQIGLHTGLEYLKKFKVFTVDIRDSFPIALGFLQNGASPLEMVKAYSAISNRGQLVSGGTLKKIEIANGEVTLPEKKPKQYRVFSERTSEELVSLLTAVVERGTGKSAYIEGEQVYGKTGTNSNDGWFIGGVENYTAAVWVGNERMKPDQKQEVSGGSYPAALFKNVMSEVIK
ncbi:penicillin-binding transpeptidase domain-containing protein [Neobacillus sp. OS1-2]|uniref:transglycosylase domain-containing protein n=1 Tax=Neobacillus sp. OS1-2 TaxID=3070680 RepID=UPI0027DFCD33|nr:penicillin-binding transpeptidase domain-containing protein [Neobacillus sp. OS1-2]WML41220.1 penicillin-binding transpeptidase domain-containing protein [Neobacillus sp. OS1-2]